MHTSIELRGARTHNLKNISCSFEHGQLTVVTGVSGSGKSSLAFDTLYAEGQRRYVESMSTYARQFLERMERPDIDSISGVQPAIALEQKNGVRSARSTVGTATEVHDYLRLLFAKLGETFCPDCKTPVRRETPESAIHAIEQMPEGTRLVVLGPTEMIGSHLNESLRGELIRSGYFRLWDGKKYLDVEAGDSPGDPGAELSIVVDRIAWAPKRRVRLHEALQKAFLAGHGRAQVNYEDIAEREEGEAANGAKGTPRTLKFSAGMSCEGCSKVFPQPEPPLFSFYSPLGACPECEGFGRVMELDLEKVIPNPELSISDGAIAPWNSQGSIEMYDLLYQRTTPQQIPRNKPLSEFTPAQQANLLEGVGRFAGIRGFFRYLERKKYRVQARVMLARYRAYRQCPECLGRRLKPESLGVLLQGKNIAEIAMLPVDLALDYFRGIELSPRENEVAGKILEALIARLAYLDQIGLPYLTLDRATRTLSGGEAQRINLASSLGSGLTQTLYVLDEPTVGLHSRDTERLISVLQSLRDIGNTVVVVEHDLEVIREADCVMDIGPGAGEAGGELLFTGSAEDLRDAQSKTGEHIRNYHTPPVPSLGRKPTGAIQIKGARGNNLKNLNVKIPLGCLCCVVGVSGSGKTTLIRDTLTAAYRRKRDLAPIEVEPYKAIEGLEQIGELHWVDQSALSRSKRSNPATYVKAFDAIRQTLGTCREARAAGLQPRHFSFNVEAGRCPTCKGTGFQTIDMHFMADVSVLCEDCDGRRFRNHVLSMRWRGKSIHDILCLTVVEASEFFRGEAKIVRALKPLRDVGLGYLRLGQNTSTLSGGEAQRLKLAGHLVKKKQDERTLLIFDEPTTGLHAADLTRLLKIFHQLIDRGASVVVIEHNLDLIASADTLIELGPEGGDKGGKIIAQGSSAKVMKNPKSLTAKYLKERFGDQLGV